MKKILLVDNHRLFAQGVASLLENLHECQVGEIVYEKQEALHAIQLHKPDLVVVGYHTPSENGFEFSKALLREFSSLKILLLCKSQQPSVTDLRVYGITGYLNKDTGAEELRKAIINVINDTSSTKTEHFSKLKATQSTLPYYQTHTLTSRETDVINCIKSGHNTRQIAEKLGISYFTAETHRKNIYAKLGIKGGERQLLNFLYNEANMR